MISFEHSTVEKTDKRSTLSREYYPFSRVARERSKANRRRKSSRIGCAGFSRGVIIIETEIAHGIDRY